MINNSQPTAQRWWRRPWVIPLALVTFIFLCTVLPRYLGLDPSRSLSDPQLDIPWFYPLLVTHIFLGSIVLTTACLQVWPWLRRRHPTVHRVSGRIYVAALIPASLCVIMIAGQGQLGANQQVANTMLGVLWLLTTIMGWRTARAKRFREHREWMLRSFALSFSIVANRFWGVVCVLVFAPELAGERDPAALAQAAGLSTWLSWVVNLLLIELWLHRRKKPERRRPTPDRTSEVVPVA